MVMPIAQPPRRYFAPKSRPVRNGTAGSTPAASIPMTDLPTTSVRVRSRPRRNRSFICVS